MPTVLVMIPKQFTTISKTMMEQCNGSPMYRSSSSLKT